MAEITSELFRPPLRIHNAPEKGLSNKIELVFENIFCYTHTLGRPEERDAPRREKSLNGKHGNG